MAIEYVYESGNIDKTGTNRLTDIVHSDSLHDFYLVHPEFKEVWDLGEMLESSRSIKHNEAGRSIKRLLVMLYRDNITGNLANLLDYTKKFNKRIINNSSNEVKKELAMDFVYSQILKGYKIWKGTWLE